MPTGESTDLSSPPRQNHETATAAAAAAAAAQAAPLDAAAEPKLRDPLSRLSLRGSHLV